MSAAWLTRRWVCCFVDCGWVVDEWQTGWMSFLRKRPSAAEQHRTPRGGYICRIENTRSCQLPTPPYVYANVRPICACPQHIHDHGRGRARHPLQLRIGTRTYTTHVDTRYVQVDLEKNGPTYPPMAPPSSGINLNCAPNYVLSLYIFPYLGARKNTMKY